MKVAPRYKQFGVRFDEVDAERIVQVVRARGEDMSSFIRLAVKKELARLFVLPVEEMKALDMECKPRPQETVDIIPPSEKEDETKDDETGADDDEKLPRNNEPTETSA